MTAPSELPRATAIAALLAITVMVYLPGVGGPFMFDDFANIVHQRSLHLTELTPTALRAAIAGADAGPLKRPLAVSTLALNYYFAGLDPAWYKFTNIAIHCVNGALVYALLNLLLPLVPGASRARLQLLALGVTAAWLLHPAQLNSVLYVVQRMSSLSALFVWLALIVYVRARRAQIAGSGNAAKRLLLGVPALTAAGVLCKENAVLAPAFALVIEWTCLRWRVAASVSRGSLFVFHAVFVAAPAIVAIGWLAAHPEWLRWAENWRPFSVGERLLSESRVLWHYLAIGAWPVPSRLHFYYDAIAHSRGLLQPLTTLLSLLAWLALTVAAFALRARFPLFAFGLLWFLVAHVVESSVLMLELVQVHRNYIAWFGPLLWLCATIAQLARNRTALAATAIALLVAVYAGLTVQRAWHWGDQQRLVDAELATNPRSAQAHYAAARIDLVVYAESGDDARLARGLARLDHANNLDPGFLGAPVARLTARGMHGDTVSESDLKALRTAVDRDYFELNDLSYIDAFMRCHLERRCARDPATVVAVLAATLDNRALGRRRRARVLAHLGRYYCRVLNDYPACSTVMRDAAALAPKDSLIRLEVIEALLLNGDRAAAMKRLDAIDPSRLRSAQHRAYLERLRQQLARGGA